MLNKRIVYIGAAGALLLAGGVGAYFLGAKSGSAQAAAGAEAAATAPQGPPPAVVEVAAAVSTTLAPLSEAPGSVVSLRDSLVAAATQGKIEWVADVGDEVEEGAIIARIDPADAAFTRNEARAEANRLAARAAYVDALYERFASLGEESGESEASLDEMRADRDEARQTLARAQVALERAEINLQRTEVRAPFAGRIVDLSIQVGEYATAGAAIARLVDTRRLEVTAQAPAPLLRNVKPGDAIAVAAGDERVTAPIRAIVPVGDEISRTLEVRLALPESVDWHIGSAVRIALPTADARPVIAAHRDALILRAGGIHVFVVGEDMTAQRVPVELGAADGDLIEVIGDLKAGDSLVIRGGERLRDGQKVTIAGAIAGAAS